MSAQAKNQSEEIDSELADAGFDIERMRALCDELSSSKTGLLVNKLPRYTAHYSTLDLDFQKESLELGGKMNNLILIILISSVGFITTSSLLFFGAIINEPWLFVARSAVVLFITTALFSILVLLKSMWSALFVERSLRKKAEERAEQSEEKLNVAKGVFRALC